MLTVKEKMKAKQHLYISWFIRNCKYLAPCQSTFYCKQMLLRVLRIPEKGNPWKIQIWRLQVINPSKFRFCFPKMFRPLVNQSSDTCWTMNFPKSLNVLGLWSTMYIMLYQSKTHPKWRLSKPSKVLLMKSSSVWQTVVCRNWDIRPTQRT